MLMYKEEGGFHNFADHEVEQAKVDGWIEGQSVWNKTMAEKMKWVLEKREEFATIDAQPARRAGRPKKGLSSILGMTADGDSTDNHQ